MINREVLKLFYLIWLVLFLAGCVAAPQKTPLPASGWLSPTPRAPSATVDLPELVAEIPLAAEADVIDLVYDRPHNRLYASTSDLALHVLDATTFAVLASHPGLGGSLALDVAHHRLYAATGDGYVPAEQQPRVVVYDTAEAAVVGILAPGRYAAVDVGNNRLFVGDGLRPGALPDASGVRVYDAATLALLGEIPQPGVPVYNPVRDELLIVAHTVYLADVAQLTVTRDLFPQLTAGIPFPFCTGCSWVEWVKVFAEDALLAVNIQAHAPQGAGAVSPPTWLDAATLAPVTDPVIDPVAVPTLQTACGSGGTLLFPVDGHIYRGRWYARYVVYNNFFVDDLVGTNLAWRDGIRAEYVNPRTHQAYLLDGTVLALPDLIPIGQWPASCLLAEDPARGLLFGADAGTLLVTGETGGTVDRDPPLFEALPARAIDAILLSPDYLHDRTLLVRVGGRYLYRSQDAGVSWARLRGGLPDHPDLWLGARFSPGFADDGTLFAFGHRRDSWGDGVWISTDRGDSWTPRWRNLTHLRVVDLTVSAHFSTDDTLVVEAPYYPIEGGLPGIARHRSLDRGLTWTQVATGTTASDLPPLATLLPMPPPPVLPVRAANYDRALEVRMRTEEWQPAPVTLAPDEVVRVILPAPDDATTIYVLTDRSLLRTTDAGASWAQWQDPRLLDRTYLDSLTTLAVTPRLDDGAQRLLVGTAAGEFWSLDPNALTWIPVATTKEGNNQRSISPRSENPGFYDEGLGL